MTNKKKATKSTKDQVLAVAQSWIRASLASALALYLSGITDPKVLANAFIAGLLGPLVKALQPNEKEYGISSK